MSGIPQTADIAQLSISQCATLACLLDASIPKPGNVHRSADFEDMTFYDLAISAVAIAPAFQAANQQRLGQTILQAVRATRKLVQPNTNLGIVLLLAPLAATDAGSQHELEHCIAATNEADCQDIYEAIRLCRPGGMGRVDRHDINGPAPSNLLLAMQAAAEHDMIARQYTNGFHEVLEEIVPALAHARYDELGLTDAVIATYLQTMSRYPDSLIQRKTTPELAVESAARAARVLESGPPGSETYLQSLGDFDFWLRQDGHRRNPGTTADLVTAAIFVCLRRGLITIAADENDRWGTTQA